MRLIPCDLFHGSLHQGKVDREMRRARLGSVHSEYGEDQGIENQVNQPNSSNVGVGGRWLHQDPPWRIRWRGQIEHVCAKDFPMPGNCATVIYFQRFANEGFFRNEITRFESDGLVQMPYGVLVI